MVTRVWTGIIGCALPGYDKRWQLLPAVAEIKVVENILTHPIDPVSGSETILEARTGRELYSGTTRTNEQRRDGNLQMVEQAGLKKAGYRGAATFYKNGVTPAFPKYGEQFLEHELSPGYPDCRQLCISYTARSWCAVPGSADQQCGRLSIGKNRVI